MYKVTYNKRKDKLLKDRSINSKNKEIIKKFFEWEEYKLKRKEGLSEVDERSYKTLYYYTGRIKNINIWFKGKAWEYLKRSELRHHQEEYNQIPSAQVRGVANLSMMVAKVLSLQQSHLVEQIKEVARKKLDSYGPRKDFIHQFQGAS